MAQTDNLAGIFIGILALVLGLRIFNSPTTATPANPTRPPTDGGPMLPPPQIDPTRPGFPGFDPLVPMEPGFNRDELVVIEYNDPFEYKYKRDHTDVHGVIISQPIGVIGQDPAPSPDPGQPIGPDPGEPIGPGLEPGLDPGMGEGMKGPDPGMIGGKGGDPGMIGGKGPEPGVVG